MGCDLGFESQRIEHMHAGTLQAAHLRYGCRLRMAQSLMTE